MKSMMRWVMSPRPEIGPSAGKFRTAGACCQVAKSMHSKHDVYELNRADFG
jgi:hypothetical protein